MDGSPTSPNPMQQEPYLRLQQDGKPLNSSGIKVEPNNVDASHIQPKHTPKIFIRKPFLN
jgi:hypothetical protein